MVSNDGTTIRINYPSIRFIDGRKKNPFFTCNRVSFASWTTIYDSTVVVVRCQNETEKVSNKIEYWFAVLHSVGCHPFWSIWKSTKVNYDLRELTWAASTCLFRSFPFIPISQSHWIKRNESPLYHSHRPTLTTNNCIWFWELYRIEWIIYSIIQYRSAPNCSLTKFSVCRNRVRHVVTCDSWVTGRPIAAIETNQRSGKINSIARNKFKCKNCEQVIVRTGWPIKIIQIVNLWRATLVN